MLEVKCYCCKIIFSTMDSQAKDKNVDPTVIHLEFWAYGSWDSLFPYQ